MVFGFTFGRKRPAKLNARNEPNRGNTAGAAARGNSKVQLPNNIARVIQGKLGPQDKYRMWKAMPMAVPHPRDYLHGTGKHQKWWNEGPKKLTMLTNYYYLMIEQDVPLGAAENDLPVLIDALNLFLSFKRALPQGRVEQVIRSYREYWNTVTDNAQIPPTPTGIIDLFLLKSKALYTGHLARHGVNPNFSRHAAQIMNDIKNFRFEQWPEPNDVELLQRHQWKLARRRHRRTEAAAATLIKRAYRKFKKGPNASRKRPRSIPGPRRARGLDDETILEMTERAKRKKKANTSVFSRNNPLYNNGR